MAKHYALWPSRYSDCTDPEKLNMMPFVNEDVSNFGESHNAFKGESFFLGLE